MIQNKVVWLVVTVQCVLILMSGGNWLAEIRLTLLLLSKAKGPFRDYFFWAIDFPTIPGNVIHCQCNFYFLEVTIKITRIFLNNFNLLKMMVLHEDKFYVGRNTCYLSTAWFIYEDDKTPTTWSIIQYSMKTFFSVMNVLGSIRLCQVEFYALLQREKENRWILHAGIIQK